MSSLAPGKAHKDRAERLTADNVESIIKLEQQTKAQRTRSDLIAEAIARFCGSMSFVWVHVVWFGAWVLLNMLPGLPHIDPFPFTFLTLVVSLEAIFLSTFILISQNHDARISERRNHLDLQINLLSEQENTKMIAMLRAIAEKVGAGEVNGDPKIELMAQDLKPEKVAEQIEETEQK